MVGTSAIKILLREFATLQKVRIKWYNDAQNQLCLLVHLRSVFSRMNLTFSDVASRIVTVGLFAYDDFSVALSILLMLSTLYLGVKSGKGRHKTKSVTTTYLRQVPPPRVRIMFKRKLKTLNYHSPDSAIPLAKAEDLKPLVVWLEDVKIRQYKIEERKSLREEEGKRWVGAFEQYLKRLECPYAVETHPLSAVVDWLLGVAVRYEFNEIVESNPDMRHGVGGQAASPPPPSGLPRQLSQSGDSALDIDATDPTFISGTEALAKILQITSHPDPRVLLQAIRIVVQEKLSESALSESANSTVKTDKKYTITAKECGFDLGDPVLDEAAKVLRLLHIQELRDLQTHINELIVAVQAITADPKTDQSLGKVGNKR